MLVVVVVPVIPPVVREVSGREEIRQNVDTTTLHVILPSSFRHGESESYLLVFDQCQSI